MQIVSLAYGSLNFSYFSFSEPLATLRQALGGFLVILKTVDIMQGHLRS